MTAPCQECNGTGKLYRDDGQTVEVCPVCRDYVACAQEDATEKKKNPRGSQSTMKTPTDKQLASLPKWALRYIGELQDETLSARQERDRIAAMLPWVKPGMDWFTMFCPPHREDREINIFTCDFGGTIRLATLGRNDYLFVGRSKERDL